jgi:hypothetical protein
MVHSLTRWAAVTALALFTISAACAADATGKWTWNVTVQGQEVKQMLELKQDGEKLTGSLTGPNNQKIEIKDGSVKNNEVSFVIVRERNGQEVKITYKGKLDGDMIKGTFGREGGQSRDWVATRVK